MQRIFAWILIVGFCVIGLLLEVTPVSAQDDDSLPDAYRVPVTIQLSVPGITTPVTVTIALHIEAQAASEAMPFSIVSIDKDGASAGVTIKKIQAGKIVSVRSEELSLVEGSGPEDEVSLDLPTAAPNDSNLTSPAVAVRVAANANLRAGPGTSYAVAEKVQAGDTVQVVGRNESGEWVALEDGNWIAASLLEDLPAEIAIAAAPSENETWPTYELIDGSFSFAYSPEWTVAEEEADIVTLEQKNTEKRLFISNYGSGPDTSDTDAAIRSLKARAVDSFEEPVRFSDSGTLEGTDNSVYVIGAIVDESDGTEFEFVLTISTVDDQNIGVFYVAGWSTKVGDEVMAELAKIMNSVKAIAR